MTRRNPVRFTRGKVWYILFVCILLCGIRQDLNLAAAPCPDTDISITTFSVDFGPQPLLEIRTSPRPDSSKNRQNEGLPPVACSTLHLCICLPCKVDSSLRKDDAFLLHPSEMKDWPPLPLAPPLA